MQKNNQPALVERQEGNPNKVPRELFRSDFFKEYHDLVTLLSRVMGLPTIAFFKEWMFYFIQDIIRGEARFHWAKMINENLHNQLMAMKKTSQFYMTLYLVYLLAESSHIKEYFV